MNKVCERNVGMARRVSAAIQHGLTDSYGVLRERAFSISLFPTFAARTDNQKRTRGSPPIIVAILRNHDAAVARRCRFDPQTCRKPGQTVSARGLVPTEAGHSNCNTL